MHKRIQSFKYAFRGIKSTFGKEPNLNIHLVMAVLVVLCGVLFQINTAEWMACLLCFGLVIAIEMLNTAIELLVDLVSPEHHKKAGQIKDIAAGAVLVSAIAAAIVGLVIFVPKGLALISLLFI